MKTYKVLDLHYHEDEGQGCFDGTQQECEEFLLTQTPHFMYKVVPMTKTEIETHPDNQMMTDFKKESIKISTPELKKIIGQKVTYLLRRDADLSGWGNYRNGVITDIIRKQVDFGNGDYVPFSSILTVLIKTEQT